MRRLAVLVGVLVLAVGAAVALAQSWGTKDFTLGIWDGTKLDLGSRVQKVVITANGPYKDDGTPAVGATSWLKVSAWDYTGGAWVRTGPVITSSDGTIQPDSVYTVAPGSSLEINTRGARVRALQFTTGTTVADSLGFTVDWE